MSLRFIERDSGKHLSRHLTPAFSGAVNGIGGNVRAALHGLRCNALLDAVVTP